MRALSIRGRLTFWNSAVTMTILAGTAVCAYLSMSQALLARTDASLRFEFDETVERLRQTDIARGTAAAPEAFLKAYLLSISDRRGRPLFQSPQLADRALPKPAIGETAEATSALIDGLGEHRILTGPAPGDDGVVIQVAMPLAHYYDELADLRRTLLLLFPVGLLASLIGGYWLAGRALAPVQAMTDAARRISAGNLREKIATPMPGDELGRLAETLNAMLGRLADSLDAMRRFTADASHELMTPLATIRAEAEIALQSPRSTEQHARVLSSIIEEVDRLTRLANHLLRLAQSDAVVRPAAFEPLRLDDAVRLACDRLRGIAQRGQVSMTVDDMPALTVSADSERLHQILDNVLENAVKYNRPGGSVVVRGWRAGEKAVIEIADTGVGIPAKALPHIFDRFFRVNASRNSQQGGVGLGLSIAKAAVADLGGRVGVASEPGRGSAFQIELPVSDPGSD